MNGQWPRVRAWLLSALCLVLSAQTWADARQERIARIIELSGLSGLSVQAREQTQKALVQSQASLGTQNEVIAAIRPVFATQNLDSKLAQSLQAFSDQALLAIEQSLSAPQLQEVRKKEQQALTMQKSRDYLSYRVQLQQFPPAKTRRQELAELDQAMHLTPILRQARATLYALLMQPLMSWQPDLDWPAKLERDTQTFLFYVHRSTSPQDLDALIALYRQPDLQQWLNQVEQFLAEG
ncbi:MAG: hypothetical protein RL217_234 [Pseudomonadota bacterium]